MVNVVCGPKGSGKTKKMIKMANDELKQRKGQVVFINDREKYRIKVDNHIRFINANDFNITSTEMLAGFINGLIAGNYDIDVIYIDNLLRIVNANGLNSIEGFVEEINKLIKKYDVDIILSISAEEKELPGFLTGNVAAVS